MPVMMITLWIVVGIFILILFVKDEPLLGFVYAIVLWLVIGLGLWVLSALFSSAPADAAEVSGNVDHRPCSTEPEYKRMPHTTKPAVEQFIDTPGWVAYRDITVLIKHYEFCDHPYGWLAVEYTKRKGTPGWQFYGTVLINRCMTSHGDGAPWVPCDNTVPHWMEIELLRTIP